jgi:type IV secretory pathway TrbD component
MDVLALRRRVVLTGLLCTALFLATSYTIAAQGIDDAWLLAGVALIYLLVARPLLAPVREAMQLRRRLAYQAFLDEREGRP